MNSTPQPEGTHEPESQIRTQLELEILKLKVKYYKRAMWMTLIASLTPMIPILAMTYMTDKYDERRLNIENEKFRLEQQARDLEGRRDPLNQEIARLKGANEAMSRENISLKDERDQANRQRDQFRTERDNASSALAALNGSTSTISNQVLAKYTKPVKLLGVDPIKFQLNATPLELLSAKLRSGVDKPTSRFDLSKRIALLSRNGIK